MPSNNVIAVAPADAGKGAQPEEIVADDVVETPEQKAKLARQMLLVRLHCTINMAVSILNFTTRGEILRGLVGGDYSKVAGYLSTWTSATAICEFFLNPIVGKMSDSIGRKPFMLLAPYAAISLKTWVLMRPSILSLTVERIVCDGLRTLSGTTMGTAAMIDLAKPTEVANALAGLWAFMGIAIIASPAVASQLSPRGTYKLAIAVAAVQLYTDTFYLEETLPEAKRRPMSVIPTPFSVFRLFTSGKALALASGVMGLQFLLDGKILADPWIILQLDTLKWTRKQSQMFTALVGLGLLVGSKLTKTTMKRWGEHGHTTFGNVMTVIESLLSGFYPSTAMEFLKIPLLWTGGTRMNAVKQMVTRIALETSDIGKGELSGLQANLRAMMVSIGPLIYARAYTVGKAKGLPGSAFIAAAGIALAAELVHQRLKGQLSAEKKAQRAQ